MEIDFNQIAVGDTVKYAEMRGSVRIKYTDAQYIAVVVFPQDIGWRSNLMLQDWPIDEVQHI